MVVLTEGKIMNGRAPKYFTEAGKVYGHGLYRLTAVKPLGRGLGIFKCHCGNEFTTSICNVEKGLRVSCGCFRHKRPNARKKAINNEELRPLETWEKQAYYGRIT